MKSLLILSVIDILPRLLFEMIFVEIIQIVHTHKFSFHCSQFAIFDVLISSRLSALENILCSTGPRGSLMYIILHSTSFLYL